jgi:hypothetical protein
MAYGSEHGQEPDHDHTPKANESASVAPEDRAHCWTLDGVVINQVQEYKYLGIWFQEDGGWDHHADKALNKMRSAYGYWRPLLACARLPTRVRLLMLQTFVYSAVTYGAGLGLYTVDARANVGGSQGRARHLGTAPMDCSCDALYGDTGLMALARSSMRRKFAGMTNVSTPPRGAGSSVLWTSVTLGGGVRAAPR